jgi:hypothetical protein
MELERYDRHWVEMLQVLRSRGDTGLGMFAKLKASATAFVQSYEATAGMDLCLALSAAFALGAATIWLAGIFGSIVSCLIFAGLFLVAALIMKLISGRKEQEAETELKSATQGPVNAALAVAHAFEPAARTATTSVLPSALAILLLLAGLYLNSAKPVARLEV